MCEREELTTILFFHKLVSYDAPNTNEKIGLLFGNVDRAIQFGKTRHISSDYFVFLLHMESVFSDFFLKIVLRFADHFCQKYLDYT